MADNPLNERQKPGKTQKTRMMDTLRMIGLDMAATGAVTSHGGNLSIYDGNDIWITHTGAMLGHLDASKIVCCGLAPSPADDGASMELIVHRAMYLASANATGAVRPAAVAHAHTLYTTYESFICDEIKPPDSEGRLILGSAVPVLTPKATIASNEAAGMLADQVAGGHNIAVLRGHGPFAIADTLEDAWRLISCLEHSAHLLALLEARKAC
ncbi:MAG: class II aldolase/adducin family protein [Coriobacteriales bacterium]|nr:class II aldolase/adducin family protein [Coriobacteriales bacterium]